MTAFVDVRSMVRWVAQHGTGTVIREMTEYLEADFRRWQSFDKSERVANHTPFGVIELMPISDPELYAFKYVNGHPFNPSRGYQTVTAFGVLADVHNGYPVFLAEMTLLTALRTAATSALVARALARPDSAVMAMIGSGSQSEFQAIAVRELLGITKLRIWDTDPTSMEKFVRNLAPLGFEIEVATSGSDAVRGADVITTCTADKANAVVLHNADVSSGVHINAIGGDCPGKTELDAAILHRSTVFVEYPPQTRIEGEIQQVDAPSPSPKSGVCRRHNPGPHLTRAGHGLRPRRLRPRGLLRPALRARPDLRHRVLPRTRPRRRLRRPQGPVRILEQPGADQLMRSNSDYSLTDVDEVKALIRDNPRATLISHSAQGLVVSHYPFSLEENKEGIALVSHVGRPDERLHDLGDHDVVVVFYGPSGHVSPGWYDLPTGVAT
jgi:ornithine cyclodeaminase